MAIAKPLRIRVFAEGIEIPVISAAVQVSLNAPAVASIQVVPLPEVLDFKPRTMIHVFFLDTEPDFADATTKKKIVGQLSGYKSMFTGEFIGYSFVKTPQSRAVVLQCLDHSSYWDACHATAIEYGPNGNLFTNTGVLSGTNTALFDDIVNQQASRLAGWLSDKPKTPGLTTVSGLAGGVIRMLEAIGGVPGHEKGVNDFFTVAQLRCRVLEQICAEEDDNTAATLLKVQVFDQWLRNGLQNMGGQVSFRDMLKLLFQYIYYEVVPNPAPKYDQVQESKTETKQSKIKLSESARAQAVATRLDVIGNEHLRGVLSGTTIIQGGDATDPVKVLRFVVTDIKKQQAALKAISKSATTQIRNELDKAVAQIEAEIGNGTKDLLTWLPTPVASLATAAALIRNSTAPIGTRAVDHTVAAAKSARLKSQIIRPDCFFAAAPRCNVIFPEQYTQMQYDRVMIGEVTRVYVRLYNTLVGQDALLSQGFLAPNVKDFSDALMKNLGESAYRTLMPHELHTGIVLKTEWLPDMMAGGSATNPGKVTKIQGERVDWVKKVALFHLVKYRLGPRQLSLSGRFNPLIVCGFPGVVIDRPFIISDVADQPPAGQEISQFLTTNAAKLRAPTQFLGMVIGLTHNVDQNGGVTTVSMNHVRHHQGSDDSFLGIFAQEKENTARTVRVILKLDDVKATPKLYKMLLDITPQGTVVAKANAQISQQQQTKTVAVTGKKTVQDGVVIDSSGTIQIVDYNVATTSGTKLVSYTKPGRIDGINRDLLVPVADGKVHNGSQGVYGKILGIEIPTDASPVWQPTASAMAFSKVILYEVVNVAETTSVPVEEIIRPKWFSSAYHNDNIGKRIYEPFFGCDSVVDHLEFSGTGTPPDDFVTVQATVANADMLKTVLNKDSINVKMTIERAINSLGYQYGLVKTNGSDVDEFIRAYTYRPIATFEDLLGTDFSLSFDASGALQVTKTDATKIGFHSMAIDQVMVDKGGLAGLLDDPQTQLPRINQSGKKSAIPPGFDVRKEKRDRVKAYVEALGRGPGFVG